MYTLLSGLKIIEASSFVASPTAGLYLAQMGAEVIRVDQIGGGPDFNRWPKTDDGNSLYWENLNRAKKSVAIDLNQPEGRDLLQDLAAATGQFITNFPVNGFLSHEKLAAKRADMITVRVMGNADGSPALDYTVNSAVGYPDLTGTGPAPVNHVLPAWDLITGAYAAFAMMTALHHRTATGMGQEMRIPLSDVAIGSVANMGMIAEVIQTGGNRERLGNTVYGAFGRDFVTKDNIRLMIMAITPRQWSGLVVVLGIAAEVAKIESTCGVSFAKDEGLRFTHRDMLFPLVESEVQKWNYADLKAAFDTAGCCYGPYQSMKDAAHDPALVGNNPMFNIADNPSGLRYPAAGALATIPQYERSPAQSAPLLGAHTDEILETVLGLSTGAIAALHDKGLISQS
ncbi:MAG: CoA transferase [Chakrabartia sp.]